MQWLFMEKNIIIKQWLRAEGRSAKWLAVSIGMTPHHMSRIINGKAAVSKTVALAIEHVTSGEIQSEVWGF
jgi:plasmid maintenance system antidote protein VapI